MRWVRWAAGLGLPLLVAGWAAVPALRGLRGTPEIPVAEVRRGDFRRTVEAEGNLEAATATVLTAPMDIERPIKIAWLAEEGTPVAEGDVVVRFDPSDLEKERDDGNAERDSADSRIRQNEISGRTTLTNLDRDADLAKQEIEHARVFQNKDAEIFSRTEIIEAEIDEQLATARGAHANETRAIHESLMQVGLDLLGIERRKAELKIDRARKGLDALEVTAPHAGIFLLKEHWGDKPQVGSVIWRGNPVAEIPRLDEMEAKVYVLEADAGGLEEGGAATLVLEAYPGRVYNGKVKSVDALPKRRLRWSPVQYFEVKLELEATDTERMKPGQRVVATLLLGEQENALTVPRAAIFEKDEAKIVYRRNGNSFDPVPVELGAAAPGRVVVEGGLAEGDVVALRDPTRPLDDDAAGDENDGPGPAGPGGVS